MSRLVRPLLSRLQRPTTCSISTRQKPHQILYPLSTVLKVRDNLKFGDQMSEQKMLHGMSSPDSRQTDFVKVVQDARQIFGQAVNAVIPSEMIENSLQLSADRKQLYVGGSEFAVNHNVYVVGFGKAVLGMARAVEDLLGDHVVRGVVSVPAGIVTSLTHAGRSSMLLSDTSKIRVVEGAKDNMPDAAALSAAQQVEALADSLGADDLMLVLISGGGSALLPSPVPPVTLQDMSDVTRQMARGGATITQLNTVRKTLERLKGGGLALAAQPAQVVSLVLSDVIGDPLDFIASGPTVPNLVTPKDCINLFTQLNISHSIPPNVVSLLQSKTEQKETTVDWTRVNNFLIGTNRIACSRAKQTSESLKYESMILSTELDGEVQKVAEMFVVLLRYICAVTSNHSDFQEIEKLLLSYKYICQQKLKDICHMITQAKNTNKDGVCVIASGETTVSVKGDGLGGRNQEMAVWVAKGLHDFFSNLGNTVGHPQESLSPLPKLSVAFLSAGTDGQDGPTPAAGAVVTPDFCVKAIQSGLDVDTFLEKNDSYNLLSKVNNGDHHVLTGLTGTNVMDIQVLVVKFDK